MIPLKDKLNRLIRNNIQRIAKDAGISGTITKQEQRGTDTSTPGHKDEKMVNYYCKLTSKDYKASEHLKRNNPDKVLRFIEDYARNETMPQPASKPLDLGKEIEIGRNIYVWIHRSDRLSKKTEMYARFYEFKGVDEEQGEYQLLRFIKDDCR